MKLLCVASALDIELNYGCTPAWWQFLKGLHELGHDVIAIPYAGHAFSTPWWRSYPNPCEIEGRAFGAVKRWFGGGATSIHEGAGGRLSKTLIDTWVRPRWHSHVERILLQEHNVDAVIVFSVPVNHFTGIPARIRSRFNVPVYFFDGDVPASLPRYGGFASGFRGYDGANLSEYDGFMCNSVAGADELTHMGARRVATIHWGVDPELYAPVIAPKEYDVFFYGYGVEYREEWFENMVITPSNALGDASFAIGGKGFPPTPLHVRYTGNVPFNGLRQACARARINLNVARSTHADVDGSSTLRLFELAAMGCCIVTNPIVGLERWFEHGKEVLVVHSADEAADTYRRLLANPAECEAFGVAARQRVSAEHTHRHRAAQIASFAAENSPVGPTSM
ncbi:MAG: glycosyltransferase [Candidatus Hydrogenedentes bacterium]|nr:glycosyltransferase [Candidatus Hydrogenedentota bacterium]